MAKLSDFCRSQFAHSYVNGDDVAIFNSITCDLIFGDRELLQSFEMFPPSDISHDEAAEESDLSNDQVELLVRKRLLVRDRHEDDRLLAQYRENGRVQHQGKLHLMYLLPTLRCNLACSYCFIEKDQQSKDMDPATARQAVRYFFRHSENVASRRIVFYGGEPLLNSDAVFAAADEAVRLDDDEGQVRLSIITNGFLMTPDLAGRIARRKINVSVSIDGPESVHDYYRKTISGKGTFEAARNAIAILRDEGVNPSISCTVTPVALSDWSAVLEFIHELDVPGLGFNILSPGPNSDALVDYDTSALSPTDAIIMGYCGFRERGIYEDRVMRRARPFSSRSFHYKDCLGVGGQIAVVPDGSVGPCQGFAGDTHFFPLHVGRDFEVSPFANELFAEWTERFPLMFDECVDCPAISICGGGCPLAALRTDGSIWKIDRRVCEQAQPIHEWLVWDVLCNARGSQPAGA